MTTFAVSRRGRRASLTDNGGNGWLPATATVWRAVPRFTCNQLVSFFSEVIIERCDITLSCKAVNSSYIYLDLFYRSSIYIFSRQLQLLYLSSTMLHNLSWVYRDLYGSRVQRCTVLCTCYHLISAFQLSSHFTLQSLDSTSAPELRKLSQHSQQRAQRGFSTLLAVFVNLTCFLRV